MLSDLVTNLPAKGAAAVAFDFLFIEPDRCSPAAKQVSAAASMTPGADENKPSNDDAFAAALAASPTVLATALLDRSTSVAQGKAGYAVAGDDPRPFLVSFPGASRNLSVLDQAAHGVGATTWMPDRDQVVRRIPLIFRVQEEFVPSLAAEALRVAQGATTLS